MIGGIQPGIIGDLGGGERGHNGFLDRFLFLYPKALRKEYLSSRGLFESTPAAWKKIVDTLLALSFTPDSPAILNLSPTAAQIYEQWHTTNTDLCNDPKNGPLAGVFSKLDAYCLRLALVLQLLHYACGEGGSQEIHADAMRGAIKLIEYFRVTSTRVHDQVFKTTPVDRLSDVYQKVYAALPPGEFITAEGAKVADDEGMEKKTFQRFLQKGQLFKKLAHGKYQKIL